MRSYELLIGLRYTRAKRRNHFISFISLISMLGIALGVAALIVVLSVMNGFQEELRARILGVASHIQITGPDNKLGNWHDISFEASQHPEVVATAPYVAAQGMLSYGQIVQGAVIRGILPEYESRVADIAQHMKVGNLESLRPGAFGIVLGAELAHALGVSVGEKVILIAPQGQVTLAGILPRLKQFRVVGIFEVGMYEYDYGLAFIHMQDAQVLYRLGEDVSGLRLRLADLYQAPLVATQMEKLMIRPVYIEDWTRQHANFFRAIRIEKNVMFIILLLIVAVAAFNIVSTLVMTVTDKQADIAILRTLGAEPSSITKIFVIQGAIIGMIGTATGVLMGIGLALNIDVVVPFIEHLLGMQFLAKDVYYISELPSKLEYADVVIIAAISFILTLVATLYPSWRASHINPAEALRYE
jgi:lipoprotein-releasing system permease protein